MINIFKNVLHANKVYGVNFLFILIDLQFVESIDTNNKSIWELFHMPIVVLKNLDEK